MPRTLRFSFVAACAMLVLLGTGCDLFGGTDSSETIAGSWRGTTEMRGTSYTLTLNLKRGSNATPNQSAVSGDGRLATSEQTWTLEVSGTVTKPDLSLSLQFADGRPGQLRGTVDDPLETIEAELLGGPSSFDAAPITLERR